MTETNPHIIPSINPSLFDVAEQPTIPMTRTVHTDSEFSAPISNNITRDIELSRRTRPTTISQQVHTMNHNRNRQNNQIYNAPGQPNGVVFRHESLRGNRMVQIPSPQRTPGLNRALFEPELHAPVQHEGVLIPIEHLDLMEGNRGENTEEARQGQNENPEENSHEESSVVEESWRKLARQRVLLQFIVNFVLLVAYGLVDMLINKIISVTVLFVVFNIFVVAYILILIRTKDFSDQQDHASLFLSLLDTLTLILYVTVAFLKTRNINVPLAPFSLLGFLILFGFCCKYNLDTPSGARFILFLQKIVFWAELLLIGLSVDNRSISWSTAFIPLYFELVVLSFSSAIIIITTVFTFQSVSSEEGVSLKLFVGTIWYVLNTLYTPIWVFLVVGAGDYLETHDGDLDTVLKIGLIHSGVLFLYTLIFWKPLCEFQQFEIASETLVVEPQEHGDEESGHRHQRITFKAYKENKTNLIMISPTFYSFLDKHIKRMINRKEIEKLRKEAQKAKLEKVHRKLSLDMPHKSANLVPDSKVIVPTATANGFENLNPSYNLDFSEGDIDKNASVQKANKDENKKPNGDLCIVCFDKAPNAVFMDCGHGGICYGCALENWKRSDDCVLCRKKISRILKVVHFKPLKVIKVIESTKKFVENSP